MPTRRGLLPSVIASLYPSAAAVVAMKPLPSKHDPNQPDYAELCGMLYRYYTNSGLYDDLRALLYEQGYYLPGMKGIYTPAKRLVEFYVKKCLPGMLPDALPIETENPTIIPPIHRVWRDSNFSRRKQTWIRFAGIWGDGYLRVALENGKIRYNPIDAPLVTDLALDDERFLTYCRIDTPIVTITDDGKEERRTQTEVWDEVRADYRSWTHKGDRDKPIDKLGDPTERLTFEQMRVSFIPIVKSPFLDIGEDRGVGAYALDLDKIDEINRMATRLHQIAFRYGKAAWAVTSNGRDANNRPLAPPRIEGVKDGEALEMGDDELITLTNGAAIAPLVAQIPYADLLAILKDQYEELEKDRPELVYHRVRTMGGDLTGRAVQILLSDAVDAVIEVRGNMEEAIARANKMALHIGTAWGLPEFASVSGTYENGDWEHSFQAREVIPSSAYEQAETDVQKIAAIEAKGRLTEEWQFREAGYTESEIIDIMAERERRAEADEERRARAFDRGVLPADDDPDVSGFAA